MTTVSGAFFSGGEFTPPPSSDKTGLASDFDSFLTLLTVQMQNQNPSEPLDTNDFVTQLVQFAGVEQAINQNAKFDALLAQNASDDLLQATALVGKEVEVFGNQAIISEGEEFIRREFVYAHSDEVAETRISVVDDNNNTVYTEEGINLSGKHKFEWNGKNNNGEIVEAGKYTVKIEFKKNETSDFEPTATNIVAQVKEVLQINGELFLNLGMFSVPFSDVLATQDASIPNSDLLQASGLIGKFVEIGDDRAHIKDGYSGTSKFAYNLNNDVFETNITVETEAGEVIYETTGENTAGENIFEWDGTDNNGDPVEPGTYIVKVEYKETEEMEEFASLDVNTVAEVKEVFFDFGQIFVNLGSFSVPFGDVLNISNEG